MSFQNITHGVAIQCKNALILSVTDDSIGLPPDFAAPDSDSFGFNLIRAFAQKFNADLQIDGQHGTCVRLQFLADAK